MSITQSSGLAAFVEHMREETMFHTLYEVHLH